VTWSQADQSLLEERIADLEVWCDLRTLPADPRLILRTPRLWPSDLSPVSAQDGRELTAVASVAGRQTLVDRIAAERHRSLRQRGSTSRRAPRKVHDGRYLVCDPDFTVWDGASEHASRGFFDVGDVPPWDTWLAYVDEQPNVEADLHAKGAYWVSYLVCWVPAPLVDLVTQGICANPVECVAWASDIDTEFVRLLRAKGRL
jgi:hypothetical protein